MSARHSYANNSQDWHLVGNCLTLISAHPSRGDALAALSAPAHIEDTGWGTLDVVAPGETVAGEYYTPPPLVPYSDKPGEDWLAAFMGA